MVKHIKLTQGKFAIVDDEDFWWVNKDKWYVRRVSNNWYAARNDYLNGKPKMIHMHRFIMNCPDDKEIDHGNHDGLDNQKHNLRICTASQNSANRQIQKGNKSSKFKGVSWHEQNINWRAYIKVNGKHIHLGYFDIEEAAAKAYDRAAIKYFGEFAKLNFSDISMCEAQKSI